MTDQNAATAAEINTPTGEAAGTQNFLTTNGIESAPLEVAAQDAITIGKPAAGQTQEVSITEGQPYNLTFSETTVQSVIQDGDVLTVTFTDNSVLIINNFEAATTASPAATLAFLDNAEIIETVPDETELEDVISELRDDTTAANDPSAEEIAAVEPASGEDIAQQIANIEPAAGDDGAATGDNSNSGFTFNDPDAAPVGALGAVGPLDPTALQYGVEFNNDIVRPDEDEDTVSDVQPELLSPESINVDETNLGPIVRTGQIEAEFGSDGPGTIAPDGAFTSSTPLTSGGTPVTVAPTADGYIGTVGSSTIFTITIDPVTGNYEFTLTGTLDHPDATDPNDNIALNFGVVAEDADGDQANATLIVNVADDAPATAAPDENTVDEATLATAPIVINDTLVIDFGQDGAGAVSPDGTSSVSGTTTLTSGGDAVTITATATGYVGTIAGGATAFTIDIDPATGAYTYTQNAPLDHDATGSNTITLNFGAQVTDFDGDSTDTTITVNIIDSVPVITPPGGNGDPETGTGFDIVDETNLPGGSTVSGSVDVDFGTDAPGALTANGSTSSSTPLTSQGATVTVTQTATGYIGTLAGGATVFTLTIDPTNGDYTFTQDLPLDHPIAGDNNDGIDIVFGVTATDSDGDTDTGAITIRVLDDGPVAVDDSSTILEKTTTVNGNVVANDDGGEDVIATVTNIEFGATNINVVAGVPTVINGDYGTLTIESDGTYTYVANGTNTTGATDSFTYTLTDFDGDTDTAKLDIKIAAPDDKPELDTPAPLTVDETDIDAAPAGRDSASDTLVADFGNDGPGTFEVTGISTFSFTGAEDGALESNGATVTVAVVGNSYVGTIATGETVFTLELNETTGEYTFTEFLPLDHADTTDANDVLQLTFGATAVDDEGDRSANGDIVINVLDDGPSIATPAVISLNEANLDSGSITVNGNLTSDFGEDGAGEIATTGDSSFTGTTALSSNGEAITITSTNGGYVGTLAGGDIAFTLTVNPATGAYSFTQNVALDHVAGGSDTIALKFGVDITDFDGDTASTNISITIKDSVPVITPPGTPPGNNGDPETGGGFDIVDETNLPGGSTVSGSVDVEFGTDTPGTLTPTGTSQTSTPLTSGGSVVTITSTPTGYVGTLVGGDIAFTLTIDPANGDYTFTQELPLDHPIAGDDNDPITLTFDITATDGDGDTDTGTIVIKVLDDGPVAVDDSNTVLENTTEVSGNVVTNDDGGQDVVATVTKVEFNGTSVDVVAGTPTVINGDYGQLTIESNGAYTYVSNGTNTTSVSDNFTYTLTDFDGDSDQAGLQITISDVDDQPILATPVELTVDETDLNPTDTDGNTISANFGADGPGTYEATGEASFSFTGATDGALTSNGVPVTVALVGNNYVGTANGETIFTLELNKTTGEYDFTLSGTLDHADKTNPDDTIELSFGVTVKDTDGDNASGFIKVNVKDDGPFINGRASRIEENGLETGPIVITDSLTNSYGEDGRGEINPTGTSVVKTEVGGTPQTLFSNGEEVTITATANGYQGVTASGTPVFTLTVNDNGQYTYTQVTGIDHPVDKDVLWLQFEVEIVDFDGDTDTALITIDVVDSSIVNVTDTEELTVDETDINPTDEADGQITATFAEGPGTYTATGAGTFTFDGTKDGTLTSNGTPVTVTLDGNDYVGTANGNEIFRLDLNKTTGEYDFILSGQLDHADATNPDDVIALTFGVTVADADGDSKTIDIKVNVKDDGPVAVDDTNTVPPSVKTIGGNVVANDDGGEDVVATVTKIEFNGTSVDVVAGTPTVINGDYGVLTIEADGTYSYSSNNTNTTAVDEKFTYTLTDADGDSDTANLTITVSDIDDEPLLVKPEELTVDETDLNPTDEDGGTISAQFGADGPGTYEATGADTFTFSGSTNTTTLTSNGVPVVVALVGNNYVGTAGGETIFTLVLNKTTGTYDFTLSGQLDHADTTDPDDTIELNFGVTVKDTDGDSASGLITVNVKDDGPIAVADSNTVPENGNSVGGNVVANDDGGEDVVATVTKIEFNGTSVDVVAGTPTVINGTYGELSIEADGTYTYTSNGAQATTVQDVFTYTLTDADGDSDTADLTLQITEADDQPILVAPPALVVDETDLNPTDTDGNTISADFGTDGPGTYEATGVGTFTFTGATNDALTSNGTPVTVSIVGNNYVGSANGSEVFRLELNKTTGEYDFILSGTLDHADTTDHDDTIALTFGVTVKDADGDSASGIINVNVKDDGPFINVSTNSVDEDSLETGPIVVERTLVFDYGHDGAGEINATGNFVANFDGSTANQTLTSNGVEIIVTSTDDGYQGTTTNGDTVFTLEVSDNGEYTYTQSAVLDHPDLTDPNDVIALNFEVEIIDADGDTATNVIEINIADGFEASELLIVGENVDDIPGETTPWEIGDGDGQIIGNTNNDILVGDVGGSRLEQQDQDYNVVLILDTSGSMGENTSETSRVSILSEAVKNLMAQFESYENGHIVARVIDFSTGVRQEVTIDFSEANALADAIAHLDALSGSGLTNYESPLAAALDWLNNSSEVLPNAITTTYFISDGEPNRYDDNGNIESADDDVILGEITGTDGSNEVGDLQAFGEVIAVGIDIAPTALANLNAVDSSGTATNLTDPNDLDATLAAANPLNKLSDAGDDIITGGAGDDLIYGDSVFTDTLADDQGLDTIDGNGWNVFTRLENGEGNDASWDREDTINYIRDNAETLSQESTGTNGEGRLGGNDTLDGGAGNDTIFGQEGNDIITGGEGNDVLYGGSGEDVFMYNAGDNGTDVIKDFTVGEDVLDISGMLQGYDALQDSINDFVFTTEVGGNTVLSVDVDGAAGPATAVEVAVFEALTGLDIADITNNGETTV